MESVEIRWPNGQTETLKNVAADAIYTIVEGSGIRDTTALPAPGQRSSRQWALTSTESLIALAFSRGLRSSSLFFGCGLLGSRC